LLPSKMIYIFWGQKRTDVFLYSGVKIESAKNSSTRSVDLRWNYMVCIVALVLSWSFTDAIDSIDTNSPYIYQNNDQKILYQPLEQNWIDFTYSGSSQGKISDIEITPKGRRMTSYHSHFANINGSNIKLAERTSALQGTYEARDFMKYRFTKAKIANDSIVFPFFQINIPVYVTVSSWNATCKIEYSGKSINDRDYTLNDFDQYGKDINAALFYNNKKLSKERTFASPGLFSVEAKTSGRSEFKFNHSSKNESFVIDEFYNGNFNLSIKNSYDFGSNIYYIYNSACNDWLGGLCGKIPCWDQDLEITLINTDSIYSVN